MNIAALRTKWSTLLLVGFVAIGTPLVGRAITSYGLDILVWLASGVALFVLVLYPRVGLYVILCLIPLQNLLIFEDGSTLIRFIGMVTFVAWAAQKLLKKEPFRPLLMEPLVAPMLAFVTICGISALRSDFHTWWSAMFTTIQLMVMVLILLDLIDSPKRLEEALFLLFFGNMISAGIIINALIRQSYIWSLYSYSRPEGGQGDPNFSSSGFLVILPFLFFLIRHRSGWQRLVGLVGIVVSLLAIAATVSRTGLLLLILLIASQFGTISKLSNRLKFVLVITLMFLMTASLWPWQQIEYRFSITWSGPETTTAGERVYLAKVALQNFIENPILGRGFGRMKWLYDPVHNAFLEILSELGLPGFVAFVWIWVVAWQSLAKAQKLASNLQNMDMFSLVSAIRLSLFIYLLFSLSVSNERVRMLWLMFALSEICYRLVISMHTEGSLPTKTDGLSESSLALPPLAGGERRIAHVSTERVGS